MHLISTSVYKTMFLLLGKSTNVGPNSVRGPPATNTAAPAGAIEGRGWQVRRGREDKEEVRVRREREGGAGKGEE